VYRLSSERRVPGFSARRACAARTGAQGAPGYAHLRSVPRLNAVAAEARSARVLPTESLLTLVCRAPASSFRAAQFARWVLPMECLPTTMCAGRPRANPPVNYRPRAGFSRRRACFGREPARPRSRGAPAHRHAEPASVGFRRGAGAPGDLLVSLPNPFLHAHVPVNRASNFVSARLQIFVAESRSAVVRGLQVCVRRPAVSQQNNTRSD